MLFYLVLFALPFNFTSSSGIKSVSHHHRLRFFASVDSFQYIFYHMICVYLYLYRCGRAVSFICHLFHLFLSRVVLDYIYIYVREFKNSFKKWFMSIDFFPHFSLAVAIFIIKLRYDIVQWHAILACINGTSLFDPPLRTVLLFFLSLSLQEEKKQKQEQ